MKICWYELRSVHENGINSLINIRFEMTVPDQPGRHLCPVTSEGPTCYQWVDVEDHGKVWVVIPHFPEFSIGGYDDMEVEYMPEHSGYSYVYNKAKERAWTWIRPTDSNPGHLGHRYQVCISDGKLVATPCGYQLDPKKRIGVHNPCDALKLEVF